jgi:hypothetical protein
LTEVAVSGLQLGELLAEGGEGRVFEVLPGSPQGRERCVYKELRHPRPLDELGSLVEFPSSLAARDPALADRVRSSSAWPTSVVVGPDPDLALGTVLPRAPAAFWVSHRDGARRLATLSYLANDPDRIAVAYGVMMPAPGAPERVAVVYALARLLEAWQGPLSGSLAPGSLAAGSLAAGSLAAGSLAAGSLAAGAHVVHGDLSAKNVLWSLDPVPAVYVLDCDGASICPGPAEAGPELEPAELEPAENGTNAGLFGQERPGRRLRATTPNWDDPALPPGADPTEASDRYLLAMAFLRVVGAAHFPLQSRQRSARLVNVDLELPRSWRKFPDMPGLWELCERSLSLANATERPAPGQWVAQLEQLLAVQSADGLAAAVRGAQGDTRPAQLQTPSTPPARATDPPRVTVPDVVVRPVLRHRAPSTWKLISAGAPLSVAGDEATWLTSAPGLSAAAPLTPSQLARRVMSTWGAAHSAAARWARSPGRRAYGMRRLAGLLVLDLAAACVGVFVVAMIISPWIGL